MCAACRHVAFPHRLRSSSSWRQTGLERAGPSPRPRLYRCRESCFVPRYVLSVQFSSPSRFRRRSCYPSISDAQVGAEATCQRARHLPRHLDALFVSSITQHIPVHTDTLSSHEVLSFCRQVRRPARCRSARRPHPPPIAACTPPGPTTTSTAGKQQVHSYAQRSLAEPSVGFTQGLCCAHMFASTHCLFAWGRYTSRLVA